MKRHVVNNGKTRMVRENRFLRRKERGSKANYREDLFQRKQALAVTFSAGEGLSLGYLAVLGVG